MSDVFVLGIRHHGPGSARAVAAALNEVRPDLVLIEGPPELDAVVGVAGSADLVPPVAALVYVPDEPKRAVFYPFAVFSPEWVALRYALSTGTPVRFLDLPAAVFMATGAPQDENSPLREDPLQALAAAAGYDDAERWWEDSIEHRYHGLEVFSVVAGAMRTLREGTGDADEYNELREAAMRRVLRTATASHSRIAVVCGAWHAPALDPAAWPSAASDQGRLRGLPKVKVEATWVPWTSGRLARASGYGAGITSPGWYHHVFTTADADVVPAWFVKVARLLRDEGLDVSPASVIDAVRLAESLGGLRRRPLAGLSEVTEATQAVLLGGADVPLRLVESKLLVGDEVGRVPDDTPMVPLARDLARLVKRLRLKQSASTQVVELDLRTPSGLERSRLFHRLLLLDVPWALAADAGKTKGTFKERWSLEWQPELSVALIEASGHGTTIESAATAVAVGRAASADIAELTELVEQTLLAELPDGLRAVMTVLADRAAVQHDTLRLMAAVEPLARATRYGDVRRVDTEQLRWVLESIVTRVAIGLPSAVASLDDDAAASMRAAIEQVQHGVALVDDAEMRARFVAALAIVADQAGVHGLVAGRVVRLLLDAGRLSADEARRRLSLALSFGTDPRAGATWLDGFLTGDALLLLHDHELLSTVDGWVSDVATASFDDLLPLLRRTFSRFTAAERRMLGEHVKRVGSNSSAAAVGTGGAGTDDVDVERASRVVPVLRRLLS